MPYTSYSEYIESAHWKELRIQSLNAYNNRCCVCRETENLEVHHMRYRRFYDVRTTDLCALCDYCHVQVHRFIKKQPLLGKPNKNDWKIRLIALGRWRLIKDDRFQPKNLKQAKKMKADAEKNRERNRNLRIGEYRGVLGFMKVNHPEIYKSWKK